MKRGYLLSILLMAALVVSSHAQTEDTDVQIISEENTLEKQANDFAIKLGEHIGMDDTQVTQVTTLRLVFLQEMKRLQEDKSLELEELRAEADIVQADYDIQFGSILTAEQKFKIRKSNIAMK